MKKIAVLDPIDKQTAIVVSKGTHYNPVIRTTEILSKDPIPTQKIHKTTWKDNSFENVTGNRYGRFIVIGKLSGPRGSRGKPWVVRCDCGNYTTRRLSRLKKAGNRSMCAECRNLETIKYKYGKEKARLNKTSLQSNKDGL